MEIQSTQTSTKNNIEYLRFYIDEWDELKVVEWIKNTGIKQLYTQTVNDLETFDFGVDYEKQNEYKHMDDSIVDKLIEQNQLHLMKIFIQKYRINGLGLQQLNCKVLGEFYDIINSGQLSIAWNHFGWKFRDQISEVSILFAAQKYFIEKMYVHPMNKVKNLYIDRDLVLIPNKTYVFNDIHIKNCTLSLSYNGLLILKSLSNIVLEDCVIDLDAMPFSAHDYIEDCDWYTKCNEFGYELNKIFVGKKGHPGDSCSCGGPGGNALKLESKMLKMKNCKIKSNGIGPIGGCEWWCGNGDGGSVLLVCDQLDATHTSVSFGVSNRYSYDHVGSPRVVIRLKYIAKLKRHLLAGYLRIYCNVHINEDVLTVLDQFTLVNYAKITNITGSALIFVDNEWNLIQNANEKEIISSQENSAYNSFYK